MTRALANGRHFPATGPGWQTRINDALRRAAIAARWGPEWVLVSPRRQRSLWLLVARGTQWQQF